ncbi:hypothetical protein B0H21DRAFT_825901 [Amylocystis lapponica]|nr:hypothetical protein B0H21DRAFT_827854 [Amylocystis lapponica]KAH9918258.1 hypothetical protein B0H21DRAFT_827600 [Amylocystis lapponica]KAH9932673.1 hypothetical protein B0H21DRAFT_825901 [Amylocystis lapponica]
MAHAPRKATQPRRSAAQSKRAGSGRKRVAEQDENARPPPPPPLVPPHQDNNAPPNGDGDVPMGDETEDVSCAALKAKIQELEGQLAAARSQAPVPAMVQVARPKGTAGQHYNLQNAMGLEDNYAVYRAIRGCVRNLVRAARLNKDVRWNRQPVETLSKIFKVARKEYPILARFAHDWPIDELAKAYLKRHRNYCKKTHQDAIVDAMSRAFGRHGGSSHGRRGGGSSDGSDVEMDEL